MGKQGLNDGSFLNPVSRILEKTPMAILCKREPVLTQIAPWQPADEQALPLPQPVTAQTLEEKHQLGDDRHNPRASIR